MDLTYQILASLVFVGIVIMMAPRILAVNQGKILRNIAIWVGIFLFLALAYKTVGPGKNGEVAMQQTQQRPVPAAMGQQSDQSSETPAVPAQPEPSKAGEDEENSLPSELKEEDGFSPPNE